MTIPYRTLYGSPMTKIGTTTSHRTGARGTRWRLDYQWAAVSGRAEVVELTLRSLDDPPAPITTTMLRSLNLGSAIDASRAGWAEALEGFVEDDALNEWVELMSAPPSGRGGHPPTPRQ